MPWGVPIHHSPLTNRLINIRVGWSGYAETCYAAAKVSQKRDPFFSTTAVAVIVVVVMVFVLVVVVVVGAMVMVVATVTVM